jgi:hypothetical protein
MTTKRLTEADFQAMRTWLWSVHHLPSEGATDLEVLQTIETFYPGGYAAFVRNERRADNAQSESRSETRSEGPETPEADEAAEEEEGGGT